MDFVPDGWLASFSEAVELYETTRFGERTTEYDKPILRLFALQEAKREGQRLTDDEEKELSALIPIFLEASLVMSQRRAEALKQIQQKLHDEVIKAAIQDQDSGKFYPVPGSFWTSEKAKTVKSRGLGYSSNTITGFGGFGPVRIRRKDVIQAAEPASDLSAPLTSKGAKAEREAEKDLRTRMQNRKPNDDLPVKVSWIADIIERTGVSQRGAERAWAKIRESYPELGSSKGKRKTKRADLA